MWCWMCWENVTLHHHILSRLTRSEQPHQNASRLLLEPERLASEALLGYTTAGVEHNEGIMSVAGYHKIRTAKNTHSQPSF